MTLPAPTYTVPPQNWYVEVDLPDGSGGTVTRTPSVSGDPEWSPSINHLPRVDIPIPQAEYWLDGRADNAPARVFLGGDRLPIEEVESVERRRGEGRNELRLRCVGGVELEQRVQRVFQNKAVPDAVGGLIDSETTLSRTVDDVDFSQTEPSTLVEVSTADDFREELRPAVGGSFSDDGVALEIDDADDTVARTRSSWLWTAAPAGEADLRLTDKRGAFVDFNKNAGEKQVVEFDDIDQIDNPGEAMVREVDLPPAIPHDIPNPEVGVKVRVKDVSGGTQADLEVGFNSDNTTNAEFIADGGDISNTFAWVDASPIVGGFDDGLSAGESITLVEALAVNISSTNFRFELDAICLYDKRFGHSFDNDPDSGDGGGFSAPEPYGGNADIAAVDTGRQFSSRTLTGATASVRTASGAAPTGFGTGFGNNFGVGAQPSPVSGSEFTVSVPSGSTGFGTGFDNNFGVGAQRSPVSGSEFTVSVPSGSTTAQGTVQVSVTPSGARDPHASAEFALSGVGTQAQTPTSGTDPQAIDRLTLTGQASEETRLVGETFDANLLSILQDIGDLSRSIWAVEVDSNEDLSLEWTRPGVRQASGELTASAVDLERVTQQLEAATALGGRVARQSEVVASVGSLVNLRDSRIIPGTERVVPAGGNRALDQIADYQIEYQSGQLFATPNGDIDDGQTLTVSYAFRPTGRFESSVFGGDQRLDQSFDIETATSAEQAGQAARRIVTETPNARVEATVSLVDLDPTTSVLSELSVDVLQQVRGEFRVAGFSAVPGNPTLRLGTARPLSEVVEQVERDLRDVRRRV